MLPKSPFPEGRIGPERMQDWFGQCVLAIKLAEALDEETEIITSSEFQTDEGVSDETQYEKIIKYRFNENLGILSQGRESVGHITAMSEYAKKQQAKFILVVTWVHYPRMLWVAFREHVDVDLRIAFGIPRPKEMVTDVILTFLYPVLDLMGLKQKFLERVGARRVTGKL